jgi:hypothetical protein
MFKEYDVSHCLSVSSYISIFRALSGIFSPLDIPASGASFRGRAGVRGLAGTMRLERPGRIASPFGASGPRLWAARP